MQSNAVVGFALSPQQRRVLSLDTRLAVFPYVVRARLVIEGVVDRQRLERALAQVIERHEILRTRFERHPVLKTHLQIVMPESPYSMEHLDQPLASDSSLAFLPAHFDLAVSSGVSCVLAQRSPAGGVLFLTLPSICGDARSVKTIAHELAAAYSGAELEAVEAQYADVAEHFNVVLQSDQGLGRPYWHRRIVSSKAPEVRSTPVRGPAPDVFQPEVVPMRIGSEILAKAELLSGSKIFSNELFLLTCWQGLLMQVSGNSDFVIGYASDGRELPEFENCLGPFERYLPLKAGVSPNMTFSESFTSVRDAVAEAIRWQSFLEWPAEQRFQSVCFSFYDCSWNISTDQIQIACSSLNTSSDRFHLKLNCVHTGRFVEFELWYDPAVYPEREARQLMSQYRTLVESASEAHHLLISRLNSLSHEERRRLLNEYNPAALEAEGQRAEAIVCQFEKQAAANPDAVAVMHEDGQLTYADLNYRSNQLARHLKELGVGPEVRVAVFMRRSLEMIIGLLGVFKAGSAYVPLDPNNPADRLGYMLDDSQATLILTQTSLRALLPEHGIQTLCLDSDWNAVAEHSGAGLSIRLSDENLAYVIYTSGSAGRPKGVAVLQKGLANYVNWACRTYGCGPGTRAPLYSSLGFDLTVTSLWPALVSGGVVIVAPDSEGVDWLANGKCRDEVYGLIKVTPAHLDMLRELLGESHAGPGGLFVIGGEALRFERLEYFQKRARTLGLVNEYGPTETVVGSCAYAIKGEAVNEGNVPIGRPIANTRVYIGDRWGNLAPSGAPGELLIGGAGVARGYWSNPKLTAEYFVPDEFSGSAGERLYRTGDLVRWRADAELEYLGRLDEQIKIRGYRIETGEIEAVLAAYPGILQAAVVMKEDELGEKRLIGYAVSRHEKQAAWEQLKEYLRTKLPDYMVPGAVVWLDKLPLTPNGKLDRKALPMPKQASSGAAYIGPGNAEEDILGGIVTEILKCERVGIQDNFFELGGHSLLATQVVSRVRSVFNVELSLRSLFEAPTVAGLAEKVRELQGRGQRRIPKIERVAREGNLPLSFAQQRLWFVDQLEPESRAYHVPFGVKLRGKLDVRAVERSLSEIVRRHEVLRTSFPERDGVPVQEIEEPRELKLEVVEVEVEGEEREGGEKEREQQVMELAREEWGRRFDLGRGPLLRVKLLRVGEEEHVLLLTMHHVVSDGWSVGVLSREFTALYNAYSQGEESPLEELGVQYVDFAVWQRKWLEGEVLEEQLSYWRKQLEGLETLELPTDHRRGRAGERRGGRVKVRYEKKRVEEWKGLSRREGGTLFMTLLGGMQAVLGRYTGQRDIAVGSDVANRNRLETEGLIGFFVNQLVLRSQLGEKESFQEVLRKAREASLGAYAHQDLPFERLVEELAPERELGRTPLFQVKLVLQNAPGAELRMARVKMEALEGEGQEAKFDLLLTLGEEDGGIEGTLGYAAGLFEAETMERLARHIGNLLDGAAQDAERSWEELPLLSGEEQQELVEWNRTEHAYPESLCVHQMFEEQVRRNPEAVAVVFEDRQLSYGELNARANQLAHYLGQLGVWAEVRVGVCMERSVEMVVALLGVLKAGGAYVPLDPGYPAERLAYMLEDAGAAVLLTEQHLCEKVKAASATVVCMDSDWEKIERQSPEALPSQADPENAAYLIYTSGSTGLPKGVVVTHTNVMRLLAVTQGSFGFNTQDVWTMFHSYGFDFSVWELWGGLLWGGRVVMVPYWVARSGKEFYRLLVEEKVTVLNQTPSAFGELMRQDEEEVAELALRVVIFGGEALDLGKLRKWLERHGDHNPRLVNMYGITETTVHVTYREIEKLDLESSMHSPIGQTLKDLSVYVLDQEGEFTPVGVAGELYVGGGGVSRGYLGRPELTAERFVPDRWSGESGARQYRTGDVGRRLSNGELEYLRRADRQVKVRGYRIELGEIESVLQQHPGVAQSVVDLAQGEQKRLVAWVVGEGGEEKTNDLRAHAQALLPEYMVPSFFVWLEKLPLTVNGKVDRKALPRPVMEEQDREAEEEESRRTVVEEIVAGIWAQVLGVEQVGTGKDFFELGGHSLLATQVISRVREAFGVELPLRVLFESPTVKGLARQVEQARGERGKAVAPPMVRASRERELPLSFAQQRLWFIDQLQPGSAAYNIPFGVRLSGELQREALQWSMEEIVRRHEVLRTRFPERGGVAIQEIAEEWKPEIEEVDLRGMRAEEREEEVGRRAREEAEWLFDLSRGPMVRVKLLQLEEQEHVLLVTIHHIVSDGWSTGVMVKELVALYQACQEGRASVLAEPAIQYGDYAVWQREWLQGEVLEEQLKYWREQLEGVEVLELPKDAARGSLGGESGGLEGWELSEELTLELKSLSRKEGVTLFMLLLGTWQLLLSRYSGQEDVVVGTPIAGRRWKETEGLIGFFVNTLALRTECRAEMSFREMLKGVRETTLGAYEHQDVPFEKLVEELQPERSLGRNPFFQVLFTLDNVAESKLELPGLKLSMMRSATQAMEFDLTMDISEFSGPLNGSISYLTKLYTADMARRLASDYRMLLEATVAAPDRRISEVSLLTRSEWLQIIEGWNRTEAQLAQNCIHTLFEEQVERTPDKVAVISEGWQLSYAELNEQSNRLAHYLRTFGVKPETRVGVCMERSPNLIVALLGSLKAGAAYVPLDPGYPEKRLAGMLDDAQVLVLLTQEKFRKLAPLTRRVIVLDGDSDQLGRESEKNPQCQIDPGSLAYLMYTSGSTGAPKGVAVSHQAVCNQLLWAAKAFELTRVDRVLQKASFSFDASIVEIFLPLVVGASIVSAKAGGEQNIDYLVELVGQEAVTYIDLTPSLLQSLLDHPGVRNWSALRQIACGGEILNSELVKSFGRRLPAATLWNCYGPTEATVQSTFTQCLDADEPISIGRPVANTQVYVLNQEFNPVHVRAVGNLYIGGIGLVRGYWKQPALTAEKFVPNPFSSSGERLYRTGDLARWRAGGSLEFVGRADHQVKLRGYRIELGEIEAVLRQKTGVKSTVVIVHRESDGGNERLVAYIVMEDSAPPVKSSELREFLRSKLPAYMVPVSIISLEKLPLTVNGKVDRKALPRPVMEEQDREAEEEESRRTVVEEIVAGIWAQVLGVEQVGTGKDFFELGGHSLLATQVISRVREAFGVELPLRVLFESPTVKGLARQVEQARGERGKAVAPPMVRASRERELPLSFAQQRLWFIDQLQPGSAAYNIPFGVRLSGELQREALQWSMEEIVRRHEVLRTRFPERGGVAIQEIAEEWKPEIEEVDLRGMRAEEREEEVGRRAREEAEWLFDLSRGPMVRVKLLQLEEQEHVLLVTIHHIVSDGWSTGVMVKELVALYQACQEGRASVLAEPAIQYGDYAVWQREWLQGEVLEEQLKYWREQLEGVEVLELPKDAARGSLGGESGGLEGWELSEELTLELKSLSRKEGVTLFMLLLGTWQLLLSRYSGQEDVVVGTPIAGRRWKETEGLIGFFVNTLALRTECRAEMSFREMLKGVRETTLGAYEHQDVPFEKLVEELQPERSLGRNPFFQVLFTLDNVAESKLELPGLKLSMMRSATQATKFDLILVADVGRTIGLSLGYDMDLFRTGTIRRLFGHWQRLLEGVVERPERRLSELPLLSEGERRQILREWMQPEVEYSGNTIHESFEKKAEECPDAIAVVLDHLQLSYGDLNRRANQLAHYLQALQVGSDVRVGICMDRSLDMAITILAVLKAGGAYVPLDPNHPPERRNYMLEDSGIAVLVTRTLLRDAFPAKAARVICFDQEWEGIAEQSDQNPESITQSWNLAYVIYTSGSTGFPKGVMVTHQNVINHMVWMLQEFPLAGSERLLQKTSPTFDASFWEFFGPWMRGARVVLFPPGQQTTDEVLHAIAIHGITRLQFIPSALNIALEDRNFEACKSLQRVFVGGEMMGGVIPSAFFARSRAELHNIYGPTETTIISTFYRISAQEVFPASVPIGKAIINTQTYLLNAGLEPVPVGVKGELYIGGDGLARGYLGRPSLTAEKFIPDPFSNKEGSRLYRTGDLCRYREDGNLEFLGRMDHQIKIRGYRIELGEIEAILSQHPGVRDAVVLALASGTGDRRLVGYMAARPEENLTAAKLREYMLERLPNYMVPASLVMLDAMPVTPHGKIDRNALQNQTGVIGVEARVYEAPATPVEEMVAEIYANVLGLELIGKNDNFFELGGHSLLATQVVSRLRTRLERDVPLRQLFERPTVAALAGYIASELKVAPGLMAPPLKAVPREGKLPLSYAQQRLWFLAQLEPDSTAYHVPFAIRLRGPLNILATQASLSEIVRRHEVLRTSFSLRDGGPVQQIAPELPIALTVADVSGLEQKEEAAIDLARHMVRRPFDLGRGPLLRALLLRMDETEHILLVIMHHVVCDALSISILIREFTLLYEVLSNGRSSPLPDLPLQYADYAVWQRQWLSGAVLEDQLQYWRQQLKGLTVLHLVPDHQKPQAFAHQETHLEFSVAREVASPLNTLCRREGATLFMGLLAAFKVLLYRYTGQPDIAVGSPISGRTRSELNDLVGFFLNTLVLRTDMSGNPTFRQVLCRVRETTLQAFAHQDVPIERIVEELAPKRNTTRTPLFEIFFAFESLDADRSHANGRPAPALTGELVQIATEVKRELTLNIRDLGETLAGSFEYADRLFSQEMIHTMIARFCALLAAVTRDPDKGILDISLADGTPASNVSSFNIDLRAIEPAFDEA